MIDMGDVSHKMLPKTNFADGGKVLTYKNNADYFDNHAVYWAADSRWNDTIRKKVYAGTHGFNPETGALVLLNKNQQVKIPAATQEQATAEWGRKSLKQRTDSKTPAGKQYRKNEVASSMQDVVKNPITYAPAAIASAPFIAGTIATAAPIFGAAMEAPIAGVPGLTANNALTSYFASHGIANLPNLISDWKNVKDLPSLGNATANTAFTALDFLPVVPAAAEYVKNINPLLY